MEIEGWAVKDDLAGMIYGASFRQRLVDCKQDYRLGSGDAASYVRVKIVEVKPKAKPKRKAKP